MAVLAITPHPAPLYGRGKRPLELGVFGKNRVVANRILLHSCVLFPLAILSSADE